MAISKKGLRKIVVEDEVFFWKVSPKPRYGEEIHGCELLVPIQHESNGQKLLAHFGYRYRFSDKKVFPITPSLIEKCIKKALKEGWRFSEKGSELELDCNEFTDLKNKGNS